MSLLMLNLPVSKLPLQESPSLTRWHIPICLRIFLANRYLYRKTKFLPIVIDPPKAGLGKYMVVKELFDQQN